MLYRAITYLAIYMVCVYALFACISTFAAVRTRLTGIPSTKTRIPYWLNLIVATIVGTRLEQSAEICRDYDQWGYFYEEKLYHFTQFVAKDKKS